MSYETRLELHFWSGAQGPELFTTNFDCPFLEEPVIGFRGLYPPKGATPFKWTQAIHCLSYFLVRAAAGKNSSQTENFVLSGGAASIPTSIALALRKQRYFISELFGTDATGNSLLKRFLFISNPKAKLHRPVSVRLRESFLSPSNIFIYLDSEAVATEHDIKELANELLLSLRPRRTLCTGYKNRVSTARLLAAQFVETETELAA